MDLVLCDEHGIDQILTAYKKGQIIGFPTDTVYGIGCDPFNKNSISKIFELKKRNDNKKFPILGFSKEDIKKIVIFDSAAEKIAEKFWPGQVTILLPIREEFIQIPDFVEFSIANQIILDEVPLNYPKQILKDNQYYDKHEIQQQDVICNLLHLSHF